MTQPEPHPGLLTGEPARIDWVELELRCDATITVGAYGGQASEWMKPGFSGKAHMSGMPNPEQTRAAYLYLQDTVVAPSLEALIVEVSQKLVAAQLAAMGQGNS
jgi:hypothetical protein